MRQKKSFKEWALGVFACIMKTVCPVLSVKYFTVWFKEGRSWYYDDAKERAKLFLPGVAKELKAIKKLQLTEDGIRQRVWSNETELELLKEGNYSLIGNIKSGNVAALDIICATDDAQLIARVFSQATPSTTYLRNWLKSAKENVVIGVIRLAPTAFNDLHFEDVENIKYIGALVNCTLSDASRSSQKAAQKWATEVIIRDEFMNSFLDNKQEEIELFESAMSVLISADHDFTRYLPQLERYHKKCYGAIRDRADYSAHCADYLVERLPKVWFQAETKGILRFERRYGQGCATDKSDASSWMAILRKKIGEPRVAIAALQICTYLTYGNPDEVVVDLQKALVNGATQFNVVELALSKLPEQYRSALQSKLFKAITTANEAKTALKLLPKSYRKGIRAQMAEKTVESDAGILVSYWPFASWEAETAEKAVRKLASFKALPMSKLEELPEELRAAAIEELEIQSEIVAIGRAYYGEQQKELMQQKFHSRAESYLFQLDYNWQELKQLYISSNEMDEKSFRVLVNFEGTGYGGDRKKIRDLIILHANTWGLTEREYNDLMQSSCNSSLAADLKKYCKKYAIEPVAGVGKV